jgi:hypothetical protein
MSTNGQLVFTDVDKITFKGVGNASNAVVDTLTGKIGVGVDSPDANLHVVGNSYVSTNLELGGTLIMGTVNVEAQHSLEAVTATGNTTPLTIEFTNPTTSLVASGNVEVGGDISISSNLKMNDVVFINATGETAVAVGYQAGETGQGVNTVAVGYQAGQTSQTRFATAVGNLAGQTSQSDSAVAIGGQAGQTSQGAYSVAVGQLAGASSQQGRATAVGYLAGNSTQGQDATAIGYQAGKTSQSTKAVAVGVEAGKTDQGDNAIAVGYLAGETDQGDNSIILNATGVALDSTIASSFHVKPVRGGNYAASALAYTGDGEIVEETNMHFDTAGNVGIGTTTPNNSLHVYKAAAEGTSGLFIEKASGGAETTAALFFGVNAPGENPGVAKAAIFYERNLVNGRGDLKFCNDASSDANAVTTEAVDTRMIIKNNGDVGIGTVSPDKKLHVYGSIQCHNTGTTGDENGLFLQSVGDWYNLSPGNDGYLHLLGGASGQGNMSGNFSSMKLAKLITYSDLDVNGDVNISSGNKVRINGDDAVFPRITLVNGTSYSLTSGSWTKLCDFGHNYLDGAYFIKIEWNYGGTGHYWAGMATGMVPAKSYTHVQYNHAPDEPLSLNHFYHHRTVGRFEFTLDSDNYWGASYGRIALWVKGGSTATHQFYVDVRKIL